MSVMFERRCCYVVTRCHIIAILLTLLVIIRYRRRFAAIRSRHVCLYMPYEERAWRRRHKRHGMQSDYMLTLQEYIVIDRELRHINTVRVCRCHTHTVI